MAALVCILYSVSVELYRVGCVFIESGASIGDCLTYLLEKRESILAERYLENIDEFYRLNSGLCASNGIKCINCRCKSSKMNCELYASSGDFIEIERGDEAIDYVVDYDHVSMTRLFIIHSSVVTNSRARRNDQIGTVREIDKKNNGI